MQITGPQRGSHEQVVGSFYMSNNEWVVDELAGTVGLNLKGFVVFLDLKLANFSSTSIPAGQACCIPSTGQNQASYLAPIGILLSDMIVGSKKLTGVWVNVLMYGHAERIVCNSAADIDVNDALLYVFGAASGVCGGLAQSEYTNSTVSMTGAMTIDVVSAGPAIVDYTSADSTQTHWITPLASAANPLGGAPNKSLHQFIGYHYIGNAPTNLQENLEGQSNNSTYRQVKGFVNCLGGIHSW